jgi:hypothetical protein
MNRVIRNAGTWALALMLALHAGASLAGELETGEQIRNCTRDNSPDSTSIQLIELKSVDRAAGERKMDARLHWKKSEDGDVRLMIRVISPQDLKGSSYLVIENEPRDTVYVYLPALAKPRRIVGGGGRAIWSTDFSYEDIRLLQMESSQTEVERLPDAEVAGRPTYVIATQPDPARESGYERIVSYVDKETCVALKTEYFEANGVLRKHLLVDPETIEEVSGKWIARDLAMTDLRDDTQSWIQVREISIDEDISSRYFNTVQFWRR